MSPFSHVPGPESASLLEGRPTLFERLGAGICQWCGALLLAVLCGRVFQLIVARQGGGFSPWWRGADSGFWISLWFLVSFRDALPGIGHLRWVWAHHLVDPDDPDTRQGALLSPVKALIRGLPGAILVAWCSLATPYRASVDPFWGPELGRGGLLDAWSTIQGSLVVALMVLGVSILPLLVTRRSAGDHLAETDAVGADPASRLRRGSVLIGRLVLGLGLVLALLYGPRPGALRPDWSAPTMAAVRGASNIDGHLWWRVGLANWARWERYRALSPLAARLGQILRREGGGTSEGSVVPWATAPVVGVSPGGAGSPKDGLSDALRGMLSGSPSGSASSSSSDSSTIALPKAPAGSPASPTSALPGLPTGPTGWLNRLAIQVPQALFGHVEEIHFDDRGTILSRKVFD